MEAALGLRRRAENTSSMAEGESEALGELIERVDALKAALPALLKTFSIPALTSGERASIYSERAAHVANALKRVREGAADHAALLEQCQKLVTAAPDTTANDKELLESFDKKHKAVNVHGDGGLAAELRRVFASSATVTTATGGNSNNHNGLVRYEPRFPDTRTRTDLVKLVDDWRVLNPDKLTIEYDDDNGSDVVTLTVKGLMRAYIALSRDEDPVMVERVACFGIKEAVRALSSS